MPIREWDLAAAQDVCPAEVGVNRGVNGIDGQLSTFFGFCSPSRVNWAVVGDLTTLYDLSAPSIVNLIPETRFRIVIINNSGGQIFRRMFRSPLFQNQHKIEFRKWAEMWGLSYYRYTEIPEIPPTDVRSVIEVLPNSGATEQFWDSLAAIAA